MDASIIIPTFNRAHLLELTLESIKQQTYEPSRFEILVVDDGSTDATPDVLERYGRRLENLRTIRQPNGGRGAVRNAAISDAQGRILLFVDCDCICEPTLLEQHLQIHANADHPKVVLGAVRQVFSRLPNMREKLQGLIAETLYELDTMVAPDLAPLTLQNIPDVFSFFSAQDVIDNLDKIHAQSVDCDGERRVCLRRIAQGDFPYPWLWFITNHCSANRQAVLDVGSFDGETFRGWGVEDLDLGYRLHRAGVHFDALPDATIYHQVHKANWAMKTKQGLRNFIRMCDKYEDHALYLHLEVMNQDMPMATWEQLAARVYRNEMTAAELNEIKSNFERRLGRRRAP